jgi:hypothetical protein
MEPLRLTLETLMLNWSHDGGSPWKPWMLNDGVFEVHPGVSKSHMGGLPWSQRYSS